METKWWFTYVNLFLATVLTVGLISCGGGGDGGSKSVSSQEIPVIIGRDGPGDVGNYFPLNTNNFWHYRSSNNELIPPDFSNAIIIQGMEQINGYDTWIMNESNTDGYLQGEKSNLVKDLNGIVTIDSELLSDPLLNQLTPYWEYRFDLNVGESFVQLDRTGVDLNEDLDGDMINEKVDILSIVTFVAEEDITVPVGSFPSAKMIKRELSLDITFSFDNSKVQAYEDEQAWFVADLGLVKRISTFMIEDIAETVTEELDAYNVGNFSQGVIFPAVSVVAGQISSGTSKIYAFGTPSNQLIVTGIAGLTEDVDLVVYSANICTQGSNLNRDGDKPEDCTFENISNLSYLGLNSYANTDYILFETPYEIFPTPTNEGSWENPVEIELGIPHNGQISTRGTSYYAITGIPPGIYTVFLGGLTGDADLHIYGDETYSFELDCTLRASGDVLNEPEDCSFNSPGAIYFSISGGELNRDGTSFVVLVR